MSERPTGGFEGMSPREKLGSAVRNPLYKQLSGGSESTLPLTRARFRRAWEASGIDLYINEGLNVLEDRIGWPSDDDAFVRYRRDYRTDRTFLAYWGSPKSEGDRDALGNFPDYLRRVPPSALDLDSSDPRLTESFPLWLVRLHTIMPDLVEGVAGELGDADDKWEMFDLLRGNPKLLRAVHMCYEVGGRLVKPDDNRRYAELNGWANPEGAGLITDAHQALAGHLPLEK